VDSHVKQALQPGWSYAQSAQVFDVKVKFSVDKLSLPNTPEDFLGFHREFVHPHYVCKNEVSLYCLNDDYTYFVEAPPGVQTWKTEFGSFNKPAQFNHAIRVIRMPMWAANRLADEMGDPQAPVVFAIYLPRSGSTLMLRFFEATSKCVCFAEPFFQDFNTQTMTPERYHKTVLRLMCKPIRGMQVECYMLKTLPNGIYGGCKAIQAALPDVKFIVLYKDIRECTLSYVTFANVLPLANLIIELDKLIPYYWRNFFIEAQIGIIQSSGTQILSPDQERVLKDEFMKTRNLPLMPFFLLEVLAMKRIMQMRQEVENIPAVKYNHIMADPKRCLETIFQFCGLRKELVEPALLALEEDSQKNSVVSRENLAKNKFTTNIDTHFEQQMSVIAQSLGIPLLTSEDVLPHTITF
jgi:hypothetical protein